MPLASHEQFRKNLLPKWVRFFAWVFLIMGCAMPALLASGPFYPGAMQFSLFGWEHSGSPYDLYSLLIVAYFVASGVAAYGMLWGKRWGCAAGLLVGSVGLLLALGSMFVRPLLQESGDQFTIYFRLEPLLQVPFLVVMWRIRRSWSMPEGGSDEVAAPRGSGLKVVAALVVAATVVAVVGLVVLTRMTSGMVDAAGGFFEAVNANDIAKARASLSSAAQEATSEVALRQFLVESGIRDVKSVEWPDRHVIGQQGQLKGTVTGTSGAVPLVLTFVKEDGRWRILHLSRPPVSADPAHVRAVRERADAGDATAQAELGEMYYSGNGVTKDALEADKWLRKSAEQGIAKAQFNLALLYDEGQGVRVDKAQAIDWYRKAAGQGFAKAQFNLGFAYSHGDGVEQDFGEAIGWYRKAADQDFVLAQINLGNLYANGLGVPKDDAEAVAWYRKAATLGSAEAQYRLGDAYAEGRGVDRDEQLSLEWYRKAADQGLDKARQKLSGTQ